MMEETNKVVSMTKGLSRFDGKDKNAYRDWKAGVKVYLSMSAPGIYNVLLGQEMPNLTAGGNLEKWQETTSTFSRSCSSVQTGKRTPW